VANKRHILSGTFQGEHLWVEVVEGPEFIIIIGYQTKSVDGARLRERTLLTLTSAQFKVICDLVEG
jgi:hypothetical protein